MQNTLKKMLADLAAKEAAANAAEIAYDADPMSEAAEAAFDAAYTAEFNAAEDAAAFIVLISSGLIDIKTARAMVRGHREKLVSLCNRQF